MTCINFGYPLTLPNSSRTIEVVQETDWSDHCVLEQEAFSNDLFVLLGARDEKLVVFKNMLVLLAGEFWMSLITPALLFQ